MEELLSMGFPRKDIETYLRKSNGNINEAIDFLLNKSVYSNGNVDSNVNSNYKREIDVSHSSESIIVLDISQYTFSELGVSACTSIAVSAMSELLRNRDSCDDTSLLVSAIFEGVSNYTCLTKGSYNHLSIDDVTMLIPSTIKIINEVPMQGLLSDVRAFSVFLNKIKNISDASKSIGIIITKPPETICIIIHPDIMTNNNSTKYEYEYILFDSHTRPQYGLDGSYLVKTKKINDIVKRLEDLFPSTLLTVFGENIQEDMYNMFEGTVFQLK